MRLFWPIRERALSTDSECSTASQSSLASDASFYSAAADEADVDQWLADGFPPISGGPGLGVHTFAPVSASTSAVSGPPDPSRAVPLLGPARPMAPQLRARVQDPPRQLATRLEPVSSQASPGSSASPSRRFATDASGRRPAGLPRDGPGSDTLAPSMPGSLHAQASQGPGTDEDGAASNSAAAQDAARGASSCAAPRPPPDPPRAPFGCPRPPTRAVWLPKTPRLLAHPPPCPSSPPVMLADPAGRPAGCPIG
ncbi:hypothetical protein PF002_g29802 [Phytophthora fragariae]|uniref:Uncharacterized protein n=1 Tax=Phytophthora fragariae TaxID=53985 RepID=A0A6A3QAB0_9STRA|nr:hypothetical protein PF003_g33769 [Phytophthora fragariae]KAE8919805.1 hypothetical protein PF009_g29895 [Phytophthora fragariae]KAE9064261.1 hypothetical protein PF007_g29260 [Phytophthora fragariae]KAE9071891.1 hypothetical protein PF006_g29056 [Phytophthora fragariae]KAE9171534.1 hypothetical protein PF002_g29802 [Phytophthora fragariae]